jgi:hypothetical protein
MAQRLVSWALRSGLRRGVAGGSGPWLVIAVAAGLFKFATRPSKGESTTLDLHPGERYLIVCGEEPTRATR